MSLSQKRYIFFTLLILTILLYGTLWNSRVWQKKRGRAEWLQDTGGSEGLEEHGSSKRLGLRYQIQQLVARTGDNTVEQQLASNLEQLLTNFHLAETTNNEPSKLSQDIDGTNQMEKAGNNTTVVSAITDNHIVDKSTTETYQPNGEPQSSHENKEYATQSPSTKMSKTKIEIKSQTIESPARELTKSPEYELTTVGMSELKACEVNCVDISIQPTITENMTVNDVGKLHLEVKPGGRWSPPDCTPRHKVAIIVPFRNRESHLAVFLNHFHSFLQRQKIYYQIFIIEQDNIALFNRASLMNIGYLESLKETSFDCFIFHDIDLLPENDCNLYNCDNSPRHLTVYIDKFKYRKLYKGHFGGAIAMSRRDMETVNGFSNLMFGWGGEDDEANYRLRHHGLTVSRYNSSVARYTMIKHKKDEGNPRSGRRLHYIKKYIRYHHVDGVNATRYKVLQHDDRPLYSLVSVSIPGPATPKEYFEYWKRQLYQLTANDTALQASIPDVLSDKHK